METAIIYTFPRYLFVLAVSISLVSFALGLFLLIRWKRRFIQFAGPALYLSFVSGFYFAPGLAMDHVLVDQEKVEQEIGLWFDRKIVGFQIAEVASITISTIQKKSGREELWTISHKNGQIEEIDPGDLWETNSSDIVEHLRTRGIPVNVKK